MKYNRLSELQQYLGSSFFFEKVFFFFDSPKTKLLSAIVSLSKLVRFISPASNNLKGKYILNITYYCNGTLLHTVTKLQGHIIKINSHMMGEKECRPLKIKFSMPSVQICCNSQ